MLAPDHQCLLCRDASAVKLIELVADKNKPLVSRFNDDSAEELPVHMDIAQAVNKLREAADCGTASFGHGDVEMSSINSWMHTGWSAAQRSVIMVGLCSWNVPQEPHY